MKPVNRWCMALLMALEISALADGAFYESSGQTVAFQLTKGNKAGWDANPSKISRQRNGGTGDHLTPLITAYKGSLRICFTGPKPSQASIAIYNLIGKRLMHASLESADSIVPICLPDGAYLVQLFGNNNERLYARCIVWSKT